MNRLPEGDAILAKHGLPTSDEEPVDPNEKVRVAYKHHGGAGWKRVVLRQRDIDTFVARIAPDEVLIGDEVA